MVINDDFLMSPVRPLPTALDERAAVVQRLWELDALHHRDDWHARLLDVDLSDDGVLSLVVEQQSADPRRPHLLGVREDLSSRLGEVRPGERDPRLDALLTDLLTTAVYQPVDGGHPPQGTEPAWLVAKHPGARWFDPHS